MIGLLMMINAARSVPLKADPLLTQRAQIRAQYLCEHNQWSHDGWLDSFKGLNRRVIGENLAEGFSSDKEAHTALMKSPTHRANIVKKEYTRAGISEIKCGEDELIVELFSS